MTLSLEIFEPDHVIDPYDKKRLAILEPDGVPPVRPCWGSTAEELAWSIWEYVRDHQGSLDSERCCQVIREATERAASDPTGEIARLKTQVKRSSTRLSNARRTIKKLRAQQ